MLNGPAPRRVLLPAAVLLLSLAAGLGAAARPAQATVFKPVTTYPISVDVTLSVTERTSWTGIRAGCFAPAENLGVTYHLDLNSRPRGRASHLKNGTASLFAGFAGATPSFGEPGSFRQSSSAAPWELQTQNPSGCPAASAVPSWATSPTCKRISERVSAALQTEDDLRNGRLVIVRTTKAVPSATGASIRPSCLRALHDGVGVGLASDVTISLRSTLITVPIRSLRSKLQALAEGADGARPKFRLPISIGGDCTAMTMSGSIGDRPNFVKDRYVLPNQVLGSPEDLSKAGSCTIAGHGDVVVRREGAVVQTSFRP